MESNEEIREKFFKMNFFQKVWYSISKFEKYPEMAALGVKKAILYFTELILITSILFTGIYVYNINNSNNQENSMIFLQKNVKLLTKNSNIDEEQIEKNLVEQLQNEKPEIRVLYIGFLFFMLLFSTTLINVFTLSLFGILTCFLAKIKMKYKALFNMSIYALTLPIILHVIYFAITLLTTFKIKYFDVMYSAIAYISLAAAIFIIKSNVIKQHLELMRIIEESKEKIEKTFNLEKEPEDEKEETKDEDKEKDKSNEKNDDETEGQGSNA